MRRFAVAVGISAGILLVAGQVDAQYRYTDDKGVSKVAQYKLDVPGPYRDAAVWIGPTGIGKPGLSEAQQQAKQRDDAYRRIGEANAQLVPYKQAEEQAKQAEAETAAARQRKRAEERREAAEARAEESLSLQRESVRAQQEANDLERQRQWRRRW
jgi:hypothetical protein